MNENENKEVVVNVENNDTDYIETIKQLKENSVSKDQYLKLKEENKKLISSLANGTAYDGGGQENVKPISLEELTNSFYKDYKKMSNREFAERMLEIRNRTLEETGRDLFMPSDAQYIPTQDDINTVNGLVEGLQNCIDYANGNDSVFNSELDRITIKK